MIADTIADSSGRTSNASLGEQGVLGQVKGLFGEIIGAATGAGDQHAKVTTGAGGCSVVLPNRS